jgi:hypothetical protein
MTTTLLIRAMAEELLDDTSPREQRLAKITAALNAAYKQGRTDEGYLTKMKRAKSFEFGWKAARKHSKNFYEPN